MAVQVREIPWGVQPQEVAQARPEWLRAYGAGGAQAASGQSLSIGGLSTFPSAAGVATKITAGNTATTGEVIPGISSGITFAFIAEKYGKIAMNGDFLFGEHSTSGGIYNYGFYESAATGNLQFSLDNGTTALAATSVSLWIPGAGPQVWVGTYGDGDNNIRLYLNGVQVASTAQTGNIRRISSAPLRCAFWNGGVPNFGMYAAAISSRRMSAAEVAERFSSVESAFDSIFEPQRIWVPVAAAGGGVTLTVADAAHAHAADAITLASASDLAVADSAHAHTSEVPALSADTSISVQDQAHAHTDGGPLDLSGVPSLAVDAVAHGHTSDAITLSSESLLAIADALHGHTSTSVVLVLPSAAYLLTEPFKDWDGNLLALATIPGVVVLDPATRAVLLSLADQVTQADARLRLEDAALPTGQPVVVVSFNTDGSARGVDTYTVQ